MCTEAVAHVFEPVSIDHPSAASTTCGAVDDRVQTRNSAAPIRALINGLGHMGVRGLQALLLVSDELRARGVNVTARALVDVDRAITGKVQQTLASVSPAPEILVHARTAPVDLAQLIEEIARHDREPATYLVYDASPNRFHFPNLKSVLSLPGALYLTEKPMLSNSAEQAELEAICGTSAEIRTALAGRVFCDLVETESEVCLHLADMVAAGDLEIDSLTFFRLSSSGIAKTRRVAERSGVQGGAFVDKAIHDIAVTLALLGGARDAYSVDISEATPLCFLPRTEGARTGLLDGANRIWSGARSQQEWPADGASIVRTEWHCGAKTVPVVFNASWVGVERFEAVRRRRAADAPGLAAMLKRGDGCPEWFYARTAAPGFLNEDARLLEIDGRLCGKPTSLLVNFLAASKSIVPWIWDCAARKRVTIPSRKYGANSLARVFERVLLREQAGTVSGIGFESALQAHRVLWNAHELLIPGHIDADLERKFGEDVLRQSDPA